jgi:hypothetical protein
MDVEMQKF